MAAEVHSFPSEKERIKKWGKGGICTCLVPHIFGRSSSLFDKQFLF